jgi:diketogulonate reductase-like aldo/keto reductase
MSAHPTVRLPTGEQVSALGQGTWMMGERGSRRSDEVAALRLGIELGLRLIDTAEMYADGGAEMVVGEAIAGRRKDVFIVSKVLPSNASTKGTIAACEKSLKRLKIDTIDLYLLHWPGGHPLRDTIAGFARLIKDGKIRHFGVSNFDSDEMNALSALAEGAKVAANQVVYNLARRGVEYDLAPWCRKHRVPIMAYSPLDQGRILNNRALKGVAVRHRATAAQVALAWLLAHEQTIVIPKSASESHVRENAAARDIHLSKEDCAALDRAFPPPGKKRPLEMI